MTLFGEKELSVKDLIPSASEAYKQVRRKNEELELQDTLFNITDAIEKGAYALVCSGALNGNTARVLRDKGYDVIMSCGEPKSYTISWRDK